MVPFDVFPSFSLRCIFSVLSISFVPTDMVKGSSGRPLAVSNGVAGQRRGSGATHLGWKLFLTNLRSADSEKHSAASPSPFYAAVVCPFPNWAVRITVCWCVSACAFMPGIFGCTNCSRATYVCGTRSQTPQGPCVDICKRIHMSRRRLAGRGRSLDAW